jgi:hypothetical protein
MLRIALPLTAVVLSAAAAVPPSQAASESRSCQTINGWMICLRSSGAQSAVSLSCRSVNGHTVCSGSDGLRCEAAGGRPVCRGGRGNVEILPANPRTDRLRPMEEPDWDEDDDT